MQKSATNSNQTRISWSGKVSRLTRLREGGPGRPAWLLGLAAAAAGLGLWGRSMLEAQGMNSPGPAFILLSLLWLVFLLVWVLIKAGLRDTQVTFCISDKGVAIEPSESQKHLDRRIRVLTRLVFFSTLKGGQWAAWHPFTPWNQVNKIDVNQEKGEILIRGGPWNVRLICREENFARVLDMLRQYRPQAFAGSN